MVVIKPVTMPKPLCNGCTNGAKPLVVHDAFDTTVWLDLSTSWFTPYTTVASTSLPPGAEINTFLAPAFKCALAASLVVKRPVQSSTTSTFSSAQGNLVGSRSDNK